MVSLINGLGDILDTRTFSGVPLLGSGSNSDLNYMAAGPRANHMAEADSALKLTPEEKFLYNMHLQNLNGPGKLVRPNGEISSLFQMSFERDGKVYNIPTIWNGMELRPDDAIRAAETFGLDKFPAYRNNAEAEARYEQMHHFLERDTQDFIDNAPKRGADVLP